MAGAIGPSLKMTLIRPAGIGFLTMNPASGISRGFQSLSSSLRSAAEDKAEKEKGGFFGSFFEKRPEPAPQTAPHSAQFSKRDQIIEVQTHNVKPDSVDK